MDKNKLIKLQQEYIQLLGKELDALWSFAFIHGFKADPENIEKGKRLREEMEALTKK